jgi:hypothetical protein
MYKQVNFARNDDCLFPYSVGSLLLYFFWVEGKVPLTKTQRAATSLVSDVQAFSVFNHKVNEVQREGREGGRSLYKCAVLVQGVYSQPERNYHQQCAMGLVIRVSLSTIINQPQAELG